MGITGNYRSPQMNVLTVSDSGALLPVTGTMKGIEQLQAFDPYARVPATAMYREGGIEVTGYAQDARLAAATGSWVQVKGASFDRGAAQFTLTASSETGGAVRVVTGGQKGSVACEFTIPAGTAETEITVPCAAIEGETDVYLLFAGDVTAAWWQFQPAD